MICLAKKELRQAAVTMLAFVFAASPVHSADWVIGTPTENEVFNVGASIGGSGTGLANASFTIKVKDGSTTVNSKLSGVSPEENWEDVIDPPSSGVWTTTSGMSFLSYEIWKNGQQVAGQTIRISNPGEA